MQIGISTSNLYPLPPEDALTALGGLGVDTAEVFVNTHSEVTPAFTALLKERANAAGLHIRSLHPYTSAFEPYLLFSAYERRFEDGLSVFSALFEAAAALGADYLILHGDREAGVLPAEQSIERFERVYDLGQRYGVTLLQENVVRFRASSPDYVKTMRRLLGDKAQFTLDLKQCRRSGVALSDMIDAMRGAIRHVHISDYNSGHDCLPPGTGDEDFSAVLRALKDSGFDGALIIELYRRNFDDIAQLANAAAALKALLPVS
ncbi:MAG: sugar phosphate isomerase/epimerase family protein [Acutalibacteraceae bacterium]